DNPNDEIFPGVAVIRFDGGLFFATSEALEKRIRGLLDQPDPIHAIVLDLEGVNFIDSQGSAKLGELHRIVKAEDVDLRLARVKPQVRTVLEADDVLEQIGSDHIHGNVQRAVKAVLANQPLDIAGE